MTFDPPIRISADNKARLWYAIKPCQERARVRRMDETSPFKAVTLAEEKVAERGFAGWTPEGTKVRWFHPFKGTFSAYNTTELGLVWKRGAWHLAEAKRATIDPLAEDRDAVEVILPHNARLSQLLEFAQKLGYDYETIDLIEGAVILREMA